VYDAIVVGARCAGSPTAMLLARAGYRVLLVDKATFPSDTMSSHFIHPTGIACLQRWGLLDGVVASTCPPICKWTLDFGPFALTGTPPPVDGVVESYCPRRTVLDKLLVDAAVAAGAELREGFTVDELRWDGERVSGILGHTRDGESITEAARLVIGADGMRSVVARAVQAPVYQEKPAVACAYYTYWRDVPVAQAEIYVRERRAVIAFPTNDGLTCTFVQWPQDEFRANRTDIEGSFQKALALAPDLAARVRPGTRAERYVGTADLPNFFRKPFGPGWALVGDAGYHKDPFGAQGISDAFHDAELLVTAVDEGLSERQPLEETLAGYERERNAWAMPRYELNYRLATLQPPPPDMQQLFGALVGNQAQTNRLFGALLGTVPIPEFFGPENVGRIVAAAARSDSA
jgi:2-polyprenyl-6-methoxyphenol hydroxylase-like FAD-dependent oxidoreductase